jgi:hypothetical protein
LADKNEYSWKKVDKPSWVLRALNSDWLINLFPVVSTLISEPPGFPGRPVNMTALHVWTVVQWRDFQMVRTKTMRVQGGKAPRRQMATKSNDIDVFSAETVAITGIMTPAQIREQNIRENMKMLEELGVMQSVRELEVVFFLLFFVHISVATGGRRWL